VLGLTSVVMATATSRAEAEAKAASIRAEGYSTSVDAPPWGEGFLILATPRDDAAWRNPDGQEGA
jgi:hypothetical protein